MTLGSLQIRPQICVTNLRTKSLSFGIGAGRSGSPPKGTRELRFEREAEQIALGDWQMSGLKPPSIYRHVGLFISMRNYKTLDMRFRA